MIAIGIHQINNHDNTANDDNNVTLLLCKHTWQYITFT